MDGKTALLETSKFYKENLRQNPDSAFARYIYEKRKYTKETVATFGLGSSANMIGVSVAEHLKKLGCPVETAKEYGIIYEANNTLVDCMQNRFTIEIRDVFGNLVGFSGRVLGDTKRFKYMNTKATPCFQKSKIVFNLDKAKYYINYFAEPFLIIVEGNCDVMSLWQNGIRNVVAIMGTSCSEHHAKLIKMFCRKVVLCLDSDKAGQDATLRSEKVLTEQGIDVCKMCLPKGKDADEFMQMKGGKELFENLVATAINIKKENLK